MNSCEVGANPLRWGGNLADCGSKVAHSVVDPFVQGVQAQRGAGGPVPGPDPLGIQQNYPGIVVLSEHPDSVAYAVSIASPTPGSSLLVPSKSILRSVMTLGIDGGPVGGCGALLLKALQGDDQGSSNSAVNCSPPAGGIRNQRRRLKREIAGASRCRNSPVNSSSTSSA